MQGVIHIGNSSVISGDRPDKTWRRTIEDILLKGGGIHQLVPDICIMCSHLQIRAYFVFKIQIGAVALFANGYPLGNKVFINKVFRPHLLFLISPLFNLDVNKMRRMLHGQPDRHLGSMKSHWFPSVS